MEMSTRGPWCQTYTGVAFYPLDPRPQDVNPLDIAHHLALQCRFGGACRVFYSVAEHSLRVAAIVPPEDALAGLLHDAAEAYAQDLVRPVKQALPQYRDIERRIAVVLSERFQVDLVNLPESVKRADEVMLATEKRDLMSQAAREWAWLPPPLHDRILPMTWDRAKGMFLRRLRELTGE